MAFNRRLWLALAAYVAFLSAPAFGDAEQPPLQQDPATEKVADDENDETAKLLKQLTIVMTEMVDERTVVMRHVSSKDKKKTIHLRLGNTGPVPRGSLNDAEYAEKVNAAKAALAKMVDKQMVWYKAAPDASQPAASAGESDGSPDIVLADMWNKGGRHINTALKKDGHLSEAEEYHSELARDILTAAAETEKANSYKKLDEALKENEKEKRENDKANRAKAKEAEAAREAEDAAAEGFGLAGWLGILMLVLLVVGVATNFGQASSKKTNLNRKKGKLEQFWMKLKGA